LMTAKLISIGPIKNNAHMAGPKFRLPLLSGSILR
jgi:hypothetical protein